MRCFGTPLPALYKPSTRYTKDSGREPWSAMTFPIRVERPGRMRGAACPVAPAHFGRKRVVELDEGKKVQGC
jgi:hypothetical protein